MIESTYKPEDVKKRIRNNRGNISVIRKYHMTEKEMRVAKERWDNETERDDKELKKLAGEHFFNPYRKGIYHYQIQVLYLLGANKWHNLSIIIQEMIRYMSKIEVEKNGKITNAWELFKGKSCRERALRCKDFAGRIQENMITFQRLGKLHPCGYKLRQVYSAVDIKKATTHIVKNSIFYRLSTYNDFSSAIPIRDYSKYDFKEKEHKLVNYKFIGKIITKDKVIIKGMKNEML